MNRNSFVLCISAIKADLFTILQLWKEKWLGFLSHRKNIVFTSLAYAVFPLKIRSLRIRNLTPLLVNGSRGTSHQWNSPPEEPPPKNPFPENHPTRKISPLPWKIPPADKHSWEKNHPRKFSPPIKCLSWKSCAQRFPTLLLRSIY